jgi:hypothetical protein
MISTFRTFNPPIPLTSIAMSPDAQYVVVSTTQPGYAPNEQGILSTYSLKDRVRAYRISDGAHIASNSEAPYAVYHLSLGGRQSLIAFISGELGEKPS